MAEAIRERFDVSATLVEGRGGIFDVHLDGELIYSKHETGQFPEHDEILAKLAVQET